MEYGSLEIRLNSCSGLKAFNFFKKLLVYVVVSIVNDDGEKSKKQKPNLQRQKTLTDKDGGKNPEWNQTMEFGLENLSIDAGDPLFLKFDLRCKGIIKKSIGEVRVPLKDMIDEFNGAVRYASYQVRCGGEPNGVLNFSYKFHGKARDAEDNSPKVNPSSEMHVPTERVQYPSVEVISSQKNTINYPTLDDSYLTSTSPQFCNQIPELNNIIQSVSPSPRSSGLHLYPWPSMDTAMQNRHFLNSMGYSNGLNRYPDVSQLERLASRSWKLGQGPEGYINNPRISRACSG